MTVKISSHLSNADIPLLIQNDYSINQKQISPVISEKEYKQWLSTDGVHTVVARTYQEIIGQSWAHPLQPFQNDKPIDKPAFWIHNIKVHPNWQNRGIYQRITEFYNKRIFSQDENRFFLVKTTNNRMRYLAKKTKYIPISKVSIVFLFRYLFSLGQKRQVPLRILRSSKPPEPWTDFVFQKERFWIPQYSWDNSPDWFYFYINHKLICVLQIIRPIHPTQGRSLGKFSILLHTTQIRYFSLHPDVLKLKSPTVRSIFATIFRLFPRINILICTLNVQLLSELLKFPKSFFPRNEFILYSSTKNPNLLYNNLDFQSSFIPLLK
ncbi:MAG: GNAT family N-acetyltransferase [Candidatus Hermodarchaeota archaeon]